jgi:hypothetical protein
MFKNLLEKIKNQTIKNLKIIKLICILVSIFILIIYSKIKPIFSYSSSTAYLAALADILDIYKKVKNAAKQYFTRYKKYTVTEIQWKDLSYYERTLPYKYSNIGLYEGYYYYYLTLYYENDTTYFGSENNFYKYYKPLALEIQPENQLWYDLSYEDEKRLCKALDIFIENPEFYINSDNPWDYLSYGIFISGTYCYNPLIRYGKIDELGYFGNYKSFYILCYYDCRLKIGNK